MKQCMSYTEVLDLEALGPSNEIVPCQILTVLALDPVVRRRGVISQACNFSNTYWKHLTP